MNPESAIQAIEAVLAAFQPTDAYDEMRLRNAHNAVRYITNWCPPFNGPETEQK